MADTIGKWETNSVNCVDAFDLLRGLPDASVDAIITDPPYGHNNNNNGDLIHRREAALGHGKVQLPRPIMNDGEEANDLLRRLLPEIKRVLVQGGNLCCCCGGGGPDPQFARWSLWIDEFLEFKQMVIWDKGPMGMGWHYRRSYETVLVATKPGAACKWYDETNRIENIIRHGNGLRKIIPTADDHPTPKPIALMQHFIKLHTQQGDLVVDPFAGSGTTLVAAQRLGRRFIGCDLQAEYVEMSRKRLAEPYTPPLFDEDEDNSVPAPSTLLLEGLE